jgi:hypothetical protein
MAKNFQVKYYDSDQEYRLLPNNSIKKEYLEKVDYDYKRPRFVGNFGWKTPNNKLGDGYLFDLDDYDKNYVKDVKLRANEKIFRYFNEMSAISGATLLIKLNLEKGLIYFLSEEGAENDEPIFEGRGVPALWINLVTRMAQGGNTENNSVLSVFDNLKKGDKVRMSYADAIVGNATKDLVVKNRTRVGVGKSWESDKITFTNLSNPTGVKFFGYKRANNNAVSFAIGDMGIWDVQITKLGEYQMGGILNTFSYSIGGL